MKWGKLIHRVPYPLLYICSNDSASLKTRHIISLLSIITLAACSGSNGHKHPADDSLQYYPPTPAVLDREEFRYYYRLLRDFFDSSLLKKNFNGGVLVAKNGAVIYEKYQGLVDIRKKDSLSAYTPMQLASTGKTFTSVAILRLVQENRLSLDDSLRQFFPGFPYTGITVRMLLNHRSGLPNYLYFASNSQWDKKKKVSNGDILQMLYTLKPDRTSLPNTRFSYCNTNYVLLALIIEKVTGLPFPQFMHQKFFHPLLMEHSYVFTQKDTLTGTPSFSINGIFWNYDFLDGTYGDKNIYSTPEDMLKWDQALYSGQVLNQAMLDSAFKGYSFEKPAIHNYGLGWHLEILPNGKKIVYHFGKWHGFNAAFARLMDEKVTIIVLGNRFNRAIYNSAYMCYDIFGDYHHHVNRDEPESDSLGMENKVGKPPGK